MNRLDHKKFLEDKKQMGTKPQNIINESGDIHRSDISCKPQITQRPEAVGAERMSATWASIYEIPTCTQSLCFLPFYISGILFVFKYHCQKKS